MGHCSLHHILLFLYHRGRPRCPGQSMRREKGSTQYKTTFHRLKLTHPSFTNCEITPDHLSKAKARLYKSLPVHYWLYYFFLSIPLQALHINIAFYRFKILLTHLSTYCEITSEHLYKNSTAVQSIPCTIPTVAFLSRLSSDKLYLLRRSFVRACLISL